MKEFNLEINNLRFFIRRQLSEFKPGDPDEGRVLTSLALYYRCLGIAHLLDSGNQELFVDCLSKAVAARLAYLERVSKREAVDSDIFNTIPKNRTLFDAITIGADEAASRLVTLCGNRRNKEINYEDEYLYNRFFHVAYLEGNDLSKSPELQAIVGRLTELFGEKAGTTVKLRLVRSYIEGDSDEFSAALEDTIKERAEAYSNRKDIPPAIKETESRIFVDGLAMVKIARGAGIRTKDEYETVPKGLLDLPILETPDLSSWRSLD